VTAFATPYPPNRRINQERVPLRASEVADMGRRRTIREIRNRQHRESNGRFEGVTGA
jgi:hypothetical protein